MIPELWTCLGFITATALLVHLNPDLKTCVGGKDWKRTGTECTHRVSGRVKPAETMDGDLIMMFYILFTFLWLCVGFWLKDVLGPLKEHDRNKPPPIDRIYVSTRAESTKGLNRRDEQNQSGKDYSMLEKWPRWRQMLSPNYVAPFFYQGEWYNTIEHAYQGTKAKLINPHLARKFTITGRYGKVDGEIVRNKNVPVRDWIWKEQRSKILKSIMKARYEQYPIAKDILILTRPAEIWDEFVPIGRLRELEDVRSEFW